MKRLYAVLRRRPVRVYLYGLLAPGFALAVAYGLVDSNRAMLWTALGGAVLVVTGGELAQTKTTPTADPRDDAARPLRPVRTGGPIRNGEPWKP